MESKESSGNTLVSSYVFFRDPVTDQRTCAVEYVKSVNLTQTSCTSSIGIGNINNTVQTVLEYSSEKVDISNPSIVSTIDVEGISFDSNSAGVVLGDTTKFGIFYDEVNDLLQIKYFDDIAGEYIVKKEFSN